ncbi:unnamed protein product [Spirodela intermedia]|uniref:Uncharacterized protein n=2 Tax=Spirodela intermedia TaxID=51605 RepID=A0A7I8LNU3_SPIIN|nr:unnamed protein product [Spirodela intermedia]CAA6673728.1 unnamed protein product [Spirodela intermedia]CAA7410968.1 unnamed protein product [Spirodela intermedia]
MDQPHSGHLVIITRILQYLKKNSSKRLLHKNHGRLNIQVFSNADWARSSIDRSMTSYCILLGGNLIFWKSKKQLVVS